MRVPDLVQKSPASAAVGAGRAGKLLAKLPKIHRTPALWFNAMCIIGRQIPAEIDRAGIISCDRNLAMIHFDRPRDDAAQQDAGKGERQVDFRSRNQSPTSRVHDADIGNLKIERVIDAFMKTLPCQREAVERHPNRRRVIDQLCLHAIREPAEINRPLRQPPCGPGQQAARDDQEPGSDDQQPVYRSGGVVDGPSRVADRRVAF